MGRKVFDDFILEKKVEKDIIDRYKNEIPDELLEVWRSYGFGSILNGYLKIINPDHFQDVVKDSYFRSEVSIPIFSTGLGDIIAWEENRYLRLINYRKGKFKGIAAGFEFFFEDLESESFCEKYLDWKNYSEGVEIYGKPNYDECFGYVPLLGLGGAEKVENMKKVKLIEHIYLITQFMGPIE
ncbi:T6SS immunity protein Tdi1 domain-containing protein [Bacillus paralicheniformis]|uniref:T6SS immunity protein Tdi1 domain-containing protein n=1 Tax=Bacillus paralicheniformis TaxID=1648923 RepID=UPI000D0325A1|nr:T6SS immunity protein Tdi1 domain-containing protein [Bacillus paralicheniformis]